MSDGATAGAENDQQPRIASLRIARAISWIGHPLVFVSSSLAIIVFFRLANRIGVTVLMALILAVIFPTALLLIRGVRSGQWSDIDVSVQTERRRFYPPAILLSIGGVAALLLLHAPGFIVRGAIVTLLLLVIAGVVNRYLKISLHTMFAFYCAIALLRIGWVSGVIALILASLVFWSRLHLRRHAFPDVVFGTLLGSIGAVIAAWLP
jgi:membrane-associated phospholipid phosphatase